MIERIMDDEEKANCCDELLTKLIQDERKYDENIDANFVVKNYFKNIIKNKENILLGYINKKRVIGYIFAKQIQKDGGKEYLIDGLYVDEKYRKNGIAKKLITEILNLLSKENIKYVNINVVYDNKIARLLYKKFGFKNFKIEMRKKLL